MRNRGDRCIGANHGFDVISDTCWAGVAHLIVEGCECEWLIQAEFDEVRAEVG